MWWDSTTLEKNFHHFSSGYIKNENETDNKLNQNILYSEPTDAGQNESKKKAEELLLKLGWFPPENCMLFEWIITEKNI